MNHRKKIVVFVASEKKNLELGQKFKDYLVKEGCEVSIINMVESHLPLFTSRADEEFNAKELLKKELPLVEEASGFVFIAPEYNGSTPPVFNNFLAWLSRSSKEWRYYLNGKPAAIATFSGGGGFNVLLSMRTQLSYIGMNVLGRQILTHTNKILDEETLRLVSKELYKLAGSNG